MTWIRHSPPKNIKVEVKVLQNGRRMKNSCYSVKLCGVQITLMAINAKNLICLRWQLPGWRLS